VSTSALRSAAVLAGLVLLAAACGSSAAAPPTGQSTFQRLVAGYDRYAACARAHGMPSLPDPQVDTEGNDHYPSLDAHGPWRWPQSVINGCAKVWAQVHAIRDQYDSEHRPAAETAAEYQRGVRIAECIRRHGFPTFPDPSPSGGFQVSTVPPGFQKPNISSQAAAVLRICTGGKK